MERPILFSTPMVQANKEGKKTQTRRTKGLDELNKNPDNWIFVGFDGKFFNFQNKNKPTLMMGIPCPYGKVGDILWVRESFRIIEWDFERGEYKVEYKTGETKWCELPEDSDDWILNYIELMEKKGVIEPESDSDDGTESSYNILKEFPWRPSIHMPKSACRIFLEITDIRAERLQDISEEDAKNEGVKCENGYYWNYIEECQLPSVSNSATNSFMWLWQSINGKESLDSNPFVWVVEFKRIQK